MKHKFLEKLGVKITAAFLLIFISIAFIGSLYESSQFSLLNNNQVSLVILEIIGVFFLGIVLKLLYQFILNLPQKYELLFSLLCFFFIAIIQLFVIKYLEIRPIEDLNKVTNMAIDLANQKKFLDHNTYFSMYTNNIPYAIYLSKYLSLCIKLGIRNYTLAGSLLGVFSIDISILITSLILKELKNRKTAVFFIGFQVLNPIIYLWGTFFYTTIVVIPFMMLGIYLIILLKKESKPLYFYIELALLTCVLYIGTQIRATTSFVLIGALVVFLLKLPNFKFHNMFSLPNLKKLLSSIVIITLCLFLINFSYNKMLKNCMEADYSQTSFPATHWIMMGLNGNGSFNWLDEQATLSYATHEEKVQYNKEEIIRRLHDLKATGLGKLMIEKLTYTWSDGSHDYPVIMRACHNYTKIHTYILGEKRDFFLLYCQIFNIMLFLLIIIKAVSLLTTHQKTHSLLLYIILLGGILFHLIWESNPKYSLNFIMLLLYMDSDVIDDLFSSKRVSNYYEKAISVFGIGFMVLTLIMSFTLYPRFTKDTATYNNLIQGQLVSNKNYITGIDNKQSFYQSFHTNRPFNNFKIQTFNDSSYLDANYQAEILDDASNVLYSSNFSPKSKHQIEEIEFNFPTIVPSNTSTYYIKISSKSVKPDHTINFCMSYKEGYDVFPHGELFINEEQINGDLTFSVYDKTKASFTTKFYYFIVIGSILLLEFIIYYCNRKQSISIKNKTDKSTSTL